MADQSRGGSGTIVSGTGNDDMWGDAQLMIGKALGVTTFSFLRQGAVTIKLKTSAKQSDLGAVHYRGFAYPPLDWNAAARGHLSERRF